MTTCGCENNCTCGTQSITVQSVSPIVIQVVPPSAAQSTQSTVVVGPGQGGARGPQGIQGTQGVQGTQGISGATRPIAYRHVQGSPAALWGVPHNLNFFPNVTTLDSSGAICEGEIFYRDPNYLEITFSASFSGVAFLS